MARYIATIRHHSISRARGISIHGSLDDAKAAADREFSDEQHDYDIAIYEDVSHYHPELVACRRVSASKWEGR